MDDEDDSTRVETTRRKTYDGREVEFVTLDTQTDWDWVEEVEHLGTARTLGSSMAEREDKEKADTPKSAAPSRHETLEEKTSADLYQYQMPYNDEYGIPILDLSSDTDDVKFDMEVELEGELYAESPGKSRASSDNASRGSTVRVRRASVAKPVATPAMDEISKVVGASLPAESSVNTGTVREGGMGSYVHSQNSPTTSRESRLSSRSKMSATSRKGTPKGRYQRESEKHDMLADDPQARITEEEFEKDAAGMTHGMFSGKCEFCNQPVKPFPTLEQQQMYPPESLYCCSDYQEFVQFVLFTSNEMEEEVQRKNKLINVKPHEHVGSKQERTAAKEKAVQRMRERELQRRQQEASGMQQNFFASGGTMSKAGFHKGLFGIGNLTMKDMFVARQMKTINYQLSSQKCLEEGWTLRAPSPLIDELGDDVFIPEPLNPDMLEDGKLRERPLIEKFYESGQKFLTMFPDGTGNVFYPSGNLAILISAVKLGQYFYTIHQDVKRSGVAAAFEPNGFGYCYFPNGAVRLYIDQYGGIELDASGGKRRKWSWKDQITHIHAPPFQPICIGLNRNMGVRVMSQENIALTFSSNQRSCRFNMGARLKVVAPENVPLKEIEENHIFLEEKKNQVDAILDKVSNLLKFPNHPKLDKMLPPLHISSKANKTERLKKERQSFLAQQTERDKKQAPVPVS